MSLTLHLRGLYALEEATSLPGDRFQVAGGSRQLAGVEPQAAAAVRGLLAGPGLDAVAGVRVAVEPPVVLQVVAQPGHPAAGGLQWQPPGLARGNLLPTAQESLGRGLAEGPGAAVCLSHHFPCTGQRVGPL